MGGGVIISTHRQEDWSVEADSHEMNTISPLRRGGHISEKGKLLGAELSWLCVRQKSLSDSNLSRSASVAPAAPESSVLFHPAASCGTTQHHLAAGRSGPRLKPTGQQVEQAL